MSDKKFKTLEPKIEASPYFAKYDGRNFSQVLFKPGYPLQSAELIQLQNIFNEQTKRFADHIFEDGSMMENEGGINYTDTPDCSLLALKPNWSGAKLIPSDKIKIQFTNVNGGTEIEEFNVLGVQKSFQEDERYGSIEEHPDYIIVDGVSENLEIQSGSTPRVLKDDDFFGELQNGIFRPARKCSIKEGTFYTQGYFTKIEAEEFVYWFDESLPINVQIGIELVWKITDAHEDKTLFDPAQNAYNENSPGADRLSLSLRLARRPLDEEDVSSKWKFYPLVKFKDGDIIYRVNYTTYSELGKTLALRTKEINGSFVVNEFDLNILPGSSVRGIHKINNAGITKTLDGITWKDWTIEGVNTRYRDDLEVGNYLILGPDNQAYHRLLRIETIPTQKSMVVSDIHYDDYEDKNENISLQKQWDTKTGSEISITLHDESKFNYEFGKGIAYVDGWRFEKYGTSKSSGVRARETKNIEKTVSPNHHYFVLDYDEHSQFIPNQFINTNELIDFDVLEKVDLHCTKNREFYRLTVAQAAGFNAWTTQQPGQTLMIDDALFSCIKDDLYELVNYTKNDPTGLPQAPFVYSMSINGTIPHEDFELKKIEKVNETPYVSETPSNYTNDEFDRSEVKTANNGSVTFEKNIDTYNGLSANDYIFIANTTDRIATGIIQTSSIGASTKVIEVKTLHSRFTVGLEYTIIKPSSHEYHELQYSSTKIGTVRSNSISADKPERFYFSHYDVDKTFEFDVFEKIGTDKIRVLDLHSSFSPNTYFDMILSYDSKDWKITNYDGETQTFTVNAPVNNPLPAIDQGKIIEVKSTGKDVRSIVKANYPYGKAFKGNIRIKPNGFPKVETPTGTSQKFVRLINEGDGEVKTVDVDKHAYNIFFQKEYTIVNKKITDNFTTSNFANVTLGSDRTKVYAAQDIYDPNDSSVILFFQGEKIEVLSSKIASKNLEIELDIDSNVSDNVVVHIEMPVEDPEERKKTLKKKEIDTFTVDMEKAKESETFENREHKEKSFELKHSDLYRVRSVGVAAGKRHDGTGVSYVDVTHYFDKDSGQREEAYEHGRIILKDTYTLPPPAAGNPLIYAFKVEYDYFESDSGHFFTVDSYRDIHYRKIPIFTNDKNEKFPLRNVIDFRPVRQPVGSLNDYDKEKDFTSNFIDLNYDYYLNEEKQISLDGDSASEIRMKALEENSTLSKLNILLYDLKIPAYTFECDDVEYKKIDNRRYTMKDISKLQKRIENLEDIAQLNTLELQTIQTKLITNDGDPRYKNGMIVDMFAGFTVADVEKPGFSASIDQHSMKLYPEFISENFNLKQSGGTDLPTVRDNIIFLPFTNTELDATEGNSIDTTSSTTVGATSTVKNGKLTLHPFSDNWYSKNAPAKPMLNEDNQYKNWTQLKQSAHGTQWADWDQFISGVEAEDKTIILQNATLSQKTGSMVNNKNNIEKFIDNYKINTTLKYFSKEIRVGYVFESLSRETNAYQIRIQNEDDIPTMYIGQRLHYTIATGGGSVEDFAAKFKNHEISQTISAGNVAKGIIRHILPIDGTTDQCYLYVTNIETTFFATNISISGLTGTVSQEMKFTDNKVDENGILCGDFFLKEKQFAYDSDIDIRICAVDATKNIVHVEGSSKFYIGSLIEKMTSFCSSVRPVQKKLHSHSNVLETPYIDDRTYKLLSSVPIPVFLHQPFTVSESQFISKIDLRVKNTDAVNKHRFILTIQPMVSAYLSPSLVLPFSEKIISVKEGFDSTISVNFDVPVFISANEDYAVVLRTVDNSLQFYTKVMANNTVLYSNHYTTATQGEPTASDKKIQLKFYRANFNTQPKDVNLRPYDNRVYEKANTFVTTVLSDRSRINVSSFDLSDTSSLFKWRSRNRMSGIDDGHVTPILPNKTQIHEQRKIFDNAYEVTLQINSSNPKFSPMIDLEKLSVTSIQHKINDGGLLPNLISGAGQRTGSFSNRIRLTLPEKKSSLPDHTTISKCSFVFDINGQITPEDFHSDPNFLLYSSQLDTSAFVVEKENTISNVFETDTTANVSTVSLDTYKIIGSDYEIPNLKITTEFDSTETGNPNYRYFSPIVTLADDFEAMELYVQMDSILKRSGEIFVYYRVIEGSESLDRLKDKKFERMNLNTTSANKYSSNDRSRTLEFESKRSENNSNAVRFKYFQVKVCFTSTKYVEVPIVENIRILALDN